MTRAHAGMAVILLVSSSWLQSLNKTFLTTADQPRFPHGYVPAVPARNLNHESQAFVEINDREGTSLDYQVAIPYNGSAIEVWMHFSACRKI